jgi:hypothetical protein
VTLVFLLNTPQRFVENDVETALMVIAMVVEEETKPDSDCIGNTV